MMQKEEFENYKHMIVSEQPIFHAYIDMRSNVQYHINVYVSPWYKAYNYIFWIQNTTKDKSRAFRSMLHSLHSLRIMCPMIKTHTSI